MILDAVLGEPKWLWSRIPHPAVLMGRAVEYADKNYNNGKNRRRKGRLTMLALCSLALLIGFILHLIPGRIVDIVVLTVLLAQRSLYDHVHDVAKALSTSLDAGRASVAMIVGRDTKDMTESDVARAAIESAAENLSDGVIAPIFWFLIGGLPGLLFYKITNTADSMIGYKTDEHREFGRSAARLDDAINYVPARITALLIAASTFRFDMLGEVTADAPLHRSPNAGWPEAAMAHSLNLALSGPRSYDGEIKDYPYVNADGIKELGPMHITEATWVLWRTWALVLIPAGLFAWAFF